MQRFEMNIEWLFLLYTPTELDRHRLTNLSLSSLFSMILVVSFSINTNENEIKHHCIGMTR